MEFIPVYPVVLTYSKNNEDLVLAEVPDLNIVTSGESVLEVSDKTEQAIELKVNRLRKEGKPVPEPSKMEDIQLADCLYYDEGECFVTVVNENIEQFYK